MMIFIHVFFHSNTYWWEVAPPARPHPQAEQPVQQPPAAASPLPGPSLEAELPQSDPLQPPQLPQLPQAPGPPQQPPQPLQAPPQPLQAPPQPPQAPQVPPQAPQPLQALASPPHAQAEQPPHVASPLPGPSLGAELPQPEQSPPPQPPPQPEQAPPPQPPQPPAPVKWVVSWKGWSGHLIGAGGWRELGGRVAGVFQLVCLFPSHPNCSNSPRSSLPLSRAGSPVEMQRPKPLPARGPFAQVRGETEVVGLARAVFGRA